MDPYPLTRLKTPFGSPISSSISASKNALRGASFDGFSTIVHPAAIAGATLPIIWWSGKFQGVMNAQTPIASLTIVEFRTSFSQLYDSSNFAYDRVTTRGVPTMAIFEYSIGVPTSFVMSSASSAVRFLKDSEREFNTLILSSIGELDHPPKASLAANTALSASSKVPSGTLPITSPVAGFSTDIRPSPLDSVHEPPMYNISLCIMGPRPTVTYHIHGVHTCCLL